MSTTGRGRHSVLRIFTGRRGRTGHRATCGALPALDPTRLSRFQGGRALNRKDNSSRGPRDVSGLPNVAVSRRVPICTGGRSARARAPGFAAAAAPPTHRGLALARRPGIGRALKRHPFSGLVDSAVGHRNRLPVHPASPVLLTKNGPLGALDSVAPLSEAAAPSYLFKFENRSRALRPDASNHWLYPIELVPSSSYPEGNFGGNSY
ncbi:hypothetical protein GH714_044030 [Hevea brasiliensis]|uniref:Uncharacterized protein n=1 Tax=Hevea brasiliensis TaxID=3981 RepID=A0A6A6K1K8_HEVBR|nr:hypothetical protein GH714_044030 [Hevea brasiliensis]